MYKLRPYQQEAVDKTISYFQRTHDPAVIVLPTGAGKSLVISEIAKKANGRVLVLAHVKELVEQNYKKYISYKLEAGIYSAGLNKKDSTQKVIFGSIQSVARANNTFFSNFSIVIIDECHRINDDNQTQYQTTISILKSKNQDLFILGLTATPYRLGQGWIYQYNHQGEIKSRQKKFFKQCVFELPISYMIENSYLTTPIKVDIPVTCYDFSELTESGRLYSQSEIEAILKKQRRLTPLIIKNIIDISENYNRKGIMIFCSSVKHANEVMSYLPPNDSRLIVGDTDTKERDLIIENFKEEKFKYLVNVSVLTTGFDAPHVDVIAILRPTESVSLYQQIIGRGLRLSESKEDCFILDYTGMGHNIYKPEIKDKRPKPDTVKVEVECPQCNFKNTFWGYLNLDNEVAEHFGRRCNGASIDEESQEINACGYLFRSKTCNQCDTENDVTAKECSCCGIVLIDADTKLKQAKLSKNIHILKPDSFHITEEFDKDGESFLEIKYYDFNGDYLSEFYNLESSINFKKFRINFLRSHLKKPELQDSFTSKTDVLNYQGLFRLPSYIIARKQDKVWRITEKIFSEEINHRRYIF